MAEAALIAPDGFCLEVSDDVHDGHAGRVSLRSSLGAASKNVWSLDFDDLIVGLRSMHPKPGGKAEMESAEGDFQISFAVRERGAVQVTATLIQNLPESSFQAEGEIDLSYLPEFTKQLKKLKLVPYWKG